MKLLKVRISEEATHRIWLQYSERRVRETLSGNRRFLVILYSIVSSISCHSSLPMSYRSKLSSGY